jgi:microcystin-dependent protein
MPLGIGTSTANGATAHTLGQIGGEETHVLSVTEMPSHTHVQNAHSHTTKINTTLVNTRTAGTATDNVDTLGSDPTSSVVAVNQNTGGGAAHNLLSPYLALNFIIKT